MCSGNGYKSYYDHSPAISNDLLCRHTVLQFTGWSPGGDPDRYSGRNIFFNRRLNDQCRYGSHYSEQQYSGNIYGYLYNGCWWRMCCTDSNHIGNDHSSSCSNDLVIQATPYCQTAANPSPTFSGGGVAGTFSSTAGLVFVSTATGQVNLAASTPGTYTVTNTIAASGGCAAVTATSPITITALPVATFSYTAHTILPDSRQPESDIQRWWCGRNILLYCRTWCL